MTSYFSPNTMKLNLIQVGLTKPPSFYAGLLDNCWPEKEHDSAYLKSEVDSVEVTLEDGLIGNSAGFPSHIANASYRTALVVNELVFKDYEALIPGSSANLKVGCFGENFSVNHPDLHPNTICVGDVYRIGKEALFVVSGPRMPCPKVDAFNHVQGLTALGRKTGWTGYFLKVIQPGTCFKDDEIVLMERPYPGYTITRVAQGLWGSSDEQEHSKEFLQTLAGMEFLIPRHYRDTAVQRLERLQEASISS